MGEIKSEFGKRYAETLPLLDKLNKKEEEKVKEKVEKELESCSFKGGYTKKEALTIKNFLNKNVVKIRVREYWCPICDFWHLTHKPAKRKNIKKYEKRWI